MNKGLLDLVVSKLPPAVTGKDTLLVCHDNDAAFTGAFHGLFSHVWWRTAGHEAPTVWPDSGSYGNILLPLPRGKGALQFCLHACSSVLRDDGDLYLFGLNELGIKSAPSVVEHFFSSVTSLATGGHGRLWKATGKNKIAALSLADLRQQVALRLPGGSVDMCSYPGLFAGGHLDEGTELLVSALPDIPATVLDYACGIGVVARAARQKNDKCAVTVADNDPLALLAATQNVADSTAVLTQFPADLNGTYNIVLSNPPIHQGNTQSFQIVDFLLRELPRLLKPQGKALIVTQVTVPVMQLAKAHKLTHAEVAVSRSFRVHMLDRQR